MSENAGMILSGAGAGFSAMGSYRAGQYAKQLGDYNASVAEYQAQDAITRGKESERRHRSEVKRLIGTQRANMGAQGQDPNEDSALDVQLDAAHLGELDAITIKTNAAREAWGYRVQATNERIRGQIGAAEGMNRAVGTILGTGADLALRKYGFPKTPSAPRYGRP